MKLWSSLRTAHFRPTSKLGILISWSVSGNFSPIRWLYEMHMLWHVACHAAPGTSWHLYLWSVSTEHQGVIQIRDTDYICKPLQTFLHAMLVSGRSFHQAEWNLVGWTPASHNGTLMLFLGLRLRTRGFIQGRPQCPEVWRLLAGQRAFLLTVWSSTYSPCRLLLCLQCLFWTRI